MRSGDIVSEYVDIMPDYINTCSIVRSRVYGFINKTLVIEFKRPLKILSTLEGQREGIRFIGNHSAPIECWRTGHENGGMDTMMKQVYETCDLSERESSLLFTGADVENTAIARRSYRGISLCALATAGVKSNAVRSSKDEGRFYEPGTINIIILSNMRFSSNAMTGAIITATEAKTAALQDLDIRSSFSPLVNQATGTGTDNLIIAGGEGDNLKYSGGHTRMGEILAKAVYDAVREAVSRQNNIVVGRDITLRLSERGIGLPGLISDAGFSAVKERLCAELECLFQYPGCRSFIESAFTIGDDYKKGLVKDLLSFKKWAGIMAEDIAGKEIDNMIDFIDSDNMPEPLRMALNALLNGIYNNTGFNELKEAPLIFEMEREV